ncbi:SixA phosphatase family protein [Roseovarius atlanticus]|uniref:SixA phosphatase family protein n=1 Tax=Roseovarius atlanticus TaxID=1641875 RepID=UPI001EB7387A|nr:histidine phosphatase family protein [Roseovarius atlanticus]MBY5987430.1 histidine phosphatase family protein [Roseovarius atlanticus]MBY6126070.1 histidine phosphatase family protein [Roseovarius atlanticus]MBY6149470.1 histidine phosphatase family protein [Roseovarius atlanticus]
MRRLVLMRHAKSSWGDPGLDDHDRPLNKRGKLSADALGNWLRSQTIVVDEALVSSSVRTVETLQRLGIDCDRQVLDQLYHAGSGDMLKALRTRATGQTVLMLGHNPGIAWFARDLMLAQPDHPRFEDYPTGATLVARFDIDDWNALQPGTGRFEAFVTPRDLTE